MFSERLLVVVRATDQAAVGGRDEETKYVKNE